MGPSAVTPEWTWGDISTHMRISESRPSSDVICPIEFHLIVSGFPASARSTNAERSRTARARRLLGSDGAAINYTNGSGNRFAVHLSRGGQDHRSTSLKSSVLAAANRSLMTDPMRMSDPAPMAPTAIRTISGISDARKKPLNTPADEDQRSDTHQGEPNLLAHERVLPLRGDLLSTLEEPPGAGRAEGPCLTPKGRYCASRPPPSSDASRDGSCPD